MSFVNVVKRTLTAKIYFFIEQPEKCSSGSENICSGCMNIIDEDEFISALGQEWHTECFRLV